jgi:hypothetical protein
MSRSCFSQIARLSTRAIAALVAVSVALVFCLLVALYVGHFWYRHNLPLSTDPARWGQFSDYLGGILGPLIALSALIFVARTYVLQKEHMAESVAKLQAQIDIQTRQRNDARFFELLRIYNDTIQATTYSSRPGSGVTGKAALTTFVKTEFGSLLELDLTVAARRLDVAAKLTLNLGWLGQYFRIVHTLVSQSAGILGDSRYEFVKLFRSQLSADEIALLALYASLDAGAHMRRTCCEYGLLKHLPHGRLREYATQIVGEECLGRTWQARLRGPQQAPSVSGGFPVSR